MAARRASGRRQADPRPRSGVRGRKPLLTPVVHRGIVDNVLAGNAIPTAAQAVGVSRACLYRWLQWGQEAADAAERGEPLRPGHENYLTLLQDVTQAYAQSETRAVQVIRRVMEGGELVSEEPALTGDGQPIYDEDGNLTYKRTWTSPDGRLALEYISRSNPSRWGKRTEGRIEIVGESGLPIEGGLGGGVNVERGAVIASLAQRLHETARMRAIESGDYGEDGGEVVEGEVVADDEATA